MVHFLSTLYRNKHSTNVIQTSLQVFICKVTYNDCTYDLKIYKAIVITISSFRFILLILR